jgi:hypothetical protein
VLVGNVAGGNIAIRQCIVTSNYATNGGGAIYQYSTTASVQACVFSANSSGKNGGAVYSELFNGNYTNCSFSNNTAAKDGGAWLNLKTSFPVIENCDFIGNTAIDNGGALSHEEGRGGRGQYAKVINCAFRGNSASYGGACYNPEKSYSEYYGCLFSGNKASAYGGAVRNTTSSPIYINCTFAGNSALNGGAIANRGKDTRPVFTNCIIYGNSSTMDNWESTSEVTFSTIAGGFPGSYNGSADPLFMNPVSFTNAPFTGGDYTLQFCSNAINTGTNDVDFSLLTSKDLAGNSRNYYKVNRGAYAAVPTGVSGERIYVRKGGTGNGTSWDFAMGDLQQAINSATCGDSIFVAGGTYYPNRNATSLEVLSIGNRDNAFVLKSNVSLFGGFAGNEASLNHRVPDSTNPSILSGDFNNNDTVSMTNGALRYSNNLENAYHVIISSDRSNVMMDGFTITGGRANASGSIMVNGQVIHRDMGAAVEMELSTVTITNCIVQNSHASNLGGGLYGNQSFINISQSRFLKNKADDGGAFSLRQGNSSIVRTRIDSNQAVESGGGIWADGNRLDMSNCKLTNNYADNGGGLYNRNSSTSILKNLVVSGNRASNNGGGINNATDSKLRLVGLVLSGNFGGNAGGGLYDANNASIYNSNIAANNAAVGGGIYYTGSTPVLKNCIVWGNRSGINKWEDGPKAQISFSIVQGETSYNPQFIDLPNFASAPTTNGNFRATSCFATNVGDTSNIGRFLPADDVEGQTRFADRIDIGSHETTRSSLTKWFVKTQASGIGDGTSWANASNDLQFIINKACAFDSIFVARGTYVPNRRADALEVITPGQRDNAFVLPLGVRIFGGFVGNETSVTERNLANPSNITIFSGDFNGNDAVTGTGRSLSITNNEENSYHVIIAPGTYLIHLDGVTVSGGNANGSGSISINKYKVSRQSGGGLYANSAVHFQVSNCAIRYNTASYRGGGLSTYTSAFSILNSSITNNKSGSDGGGIGMSDKSALIIRFSNIDSNVAAADGGGFFINQNENQLILDSSSVQYNYSGSDGGGLRISNSLVTISYSRIDNNIARSKGGGIMNLGTAILMMQNSTLYNNSCNENGGGIWNGIITESYDPWGDIREGLRDIVSAVAVTAKIMVNSIGKFYLTRLQKEVALLFLRLVAPTIKNGVEISKRKAGVVEMQDCLISRNSAGTLGGGIYNGSAQGDFTFIIKNSRVTGNKAYRGGGIANRESGNKSDRTAAAIHIYNSLVDSNTAIHDGGGIYNASNVRARLYNSTVVSNKAANGGGIYNAPYTGTTLNNSIVWGNYGNYGKEVYERDNSYGTPQVNSLVQMLGDDSDGNLDGRIIRPFFSDSTTGNITLLPWSLCIDAGNKSLLTDFDDIDSFDFAGNPRIVNSNVDMGAYECQGAPFSGIVYVKKGSKGNGLSWSNALGELSDALEIARISPKIKKIYVANGVYIPKYTPAYDTTGLDRTFTMIKDVQVYGGFDPGNGITDLTHIRDFTETGTVLSGILAPDANANHVVLAVDDLGNALLDGFTVRNGKSLGIATDSLTIGNIKVARASGAGITLVKTNITLANLQVLENSANVNGGGIHAQYFTGSISHLSIRGNTARANGGGLSLTNSLSSSNYITNCLVSGNIAQGSGGGIYAQNMSYGLQFNTVATNWSQSGSGGIHHAGTATAVFANNVVWGNNTSQGSNLGLVGGTNSLGSNIIQGYTGANPGANPNFSSILLPSTTGAAASTSGNYSLISCSPAINIGTASTATAPTKDLSGNPRIFGPATDLGAFENQGTSSQNVSIEQQPANVLSAPGSAVQFQVSASNVKTYQWQKNNNGTYSNLSDLNGYSGVSGAILFLNPASATMNGSYRCAITACDGTITHTNTVTLSISTIRYVDGNRPQSGSGQNWSSAFKTLSEAFRQAHADTGIDSILIAKGAYYPAVTQNSTNRDSAFTITRGGLKIYGGYPNGGGERNLAENSTILNGAIGTNVATDNSYHVMVIAGLKVADDSVVVDGITISGGYANGSGSKSYNGQNIPRNGGGGLAIFGNANGSKLSVRNSSIIGNYAAGDGGGIYINASAPLIANTLVAGNHANYGGGVINAAVSSTIFANCTLAGNKRGSSGEGGAMRNSGSFVTIYNSIIYSNQSGISNNNGNFTASNSLIQGENSGTNNNLNGNSINPMFVEPQDFIDAPTTAGNYRLQLGSSSINTGNNNNYYGLPTDRDGSSRVYDNIVDMGAYEFRCQSFRVLYVDASRSATGDGSSWATAFTTLREAMLAALCTTVDSILVASGTYLPSRAQSNALRDTSFIISRGGLKLYGGYPNGGGQRNPAANPTILSGFLSGDVSTNSSYHVLVITGLAAAADSVVVDGFTIRGGYANGSGSKIMNSSAIPRNSGGGLLINGNSDGNKVAIRNCTIAANYAADAGAGLYINTTSPLITNSLIAGNNANYGGGIFNGGSASAIFASITVAGNRAGNTGGAMRNSGSTPSIYNSIFYGNSDGVSNNNASFSAFNSLIQGATSTANNNLNGNTVTPSFINPRPVNEAPTTAGNYRLLLGSACINTGNESYLYGATTDLDGNSRMFDDMVDMGAYEFRCEAPKNLYVDASRTVSGNGESWASAYKTLAEAMATALCGNVQAIHVARGTYYPNGQQNSTNRDSAFTILRGGLKLLGGYPTGGGYRNFGLNPTILSANIGNSAISTDNSYHVLVIAGLTANADTVVVDGFTITGGYANGSGTKNYNGNNIVKNGAGGLAIWGNGNGNKLSIRNCTISGNFAAENGGGLNINASAPLVANCLVAGNHANYGGGILNGGNSSTVFANCTLAGNRRGSGGEGGAMRNSASNPIFYNSIIYGNQSGISNSNGGNFIAHYSLIQGETSIVNNNLDGNINNPQYVSTVDFTLAPTTAGNYRLQTGSVCLNMGSNANVPQGVFTNLDGNARIFDGRVDMGAYEQNNCPGYNVLYVDAGKAISGNGGSWANAFKTLAEAVASTRLCYTVDSILVAKGTYYPTGVQAGTNRDSAFAILRGGLVLLGGYPANGGIRNPASNPTILNGNIGNIADTTDNSHHVMVIAGLSATSDSVVVDGFTITGARANVNSLYSYGGTTISRRNGGGIAMQGNKGNPNISIRNCIINNNTAWYGAGIIHHTNSPSQVLNCLIAGNRAGIDGGGIYNTETSSPIITNTTIAGNRAMRSGGGIYNTAKAQPLLANSILYGNSSGIINNYTSTVANYSIIQDADILEYYGNGIIDANPLFTGAASFINAPTTSGDYRLTLCSPAVDAGSNSLLSNSNITDLLFATRRYASGMVDMGAYEYQAAKGAGPVIITQPVNAIACPGSSINLSVTASNVTAYQWQLDMGSGFTNISNLAPYQQATTATLQINGIAKNMENYFYRCVVTGSCQPNDTSVVVKLQTGTIRYVDSSRTESGDGSSWATAYKTLSEAVQKARSLTCIDSILVAKGTYYPTGNKDATNRDSAFVILRGGLNIIGGYPTTGGDRKLAENPTILSGNIGNAADTTDNSYHVLVIARLAANTAAVVVDGFGITGARANVNSTFNYGGVQVSRRNGGGIALQSNNSNPNIQVINCNIYNNTAWYGAGIINHTNVNTQIINCVISGNRAAIDGGGVFNTNTSLPKIINTTIAANLAVAGSGGGIYNAASSAPTIANSIIFSNSSGIANNNSSPAVSYSIVQGGYTGETNMDVLPLLVYVPTFANAPFEGGNYRPTACSPGINMGDDNALPTSMLTDADGNERMYNSGTIDIGAYEYIDAPTPKPMFITSPNSAAACLGGNALMTAKVDGAASYRWQVDKGTGFDDIQDGAQYAGALTDSLLFLSATKTMEAYLYRLVVASACMKMDYSDYATIEIGSARYVDESILESGSGASWATAFKTLNEALAAAKAATCIDSILVATGTYNPSAAGGQDTAFAMLRGGLKLYGGYAPGGGTRDIFSYPTVLSGQGVSEQGAIINTHHVLVIAGLAAGADSIVVDGFTINGGKAFGTGTTMFGTRAVERNYGGGLYIANNGNGAKIRLSNLVVEGNGAESRAGGLYCFAASPTLDNIVFRNNTSDGNGGAMFVANSANPDIASCTFNNNSSDGNGGAIYTIQFSSPVITNSLFSGNYAVGNGGAMLNASAPSITNTTFVNNRAASGGAMRNNGVQVFLTNSIVYGNTSGLASDAGGSAVLAYSLVQGVAAYASNIDGSTNPMFVNLQEGDYRLQACSPAIDAGNNAGIPIGFTTDLDGNPRIYNSGLVDIGAYEFQQIPGSTSNITTITTCGSYFWSANGHTYTTTGTYTASDNGCVSEVLHLTITESSSHITTITTCGSYFWLVNGQTYSTSGTYTSPTSSCVTEVLVLTITESASNTTTITACGSYLWAANGQTYITSGTYTGPTTGCVTEVLVLTITESTSNTTTITACGSYTWAANGQTYTTSGIYTGPTTGCVTEVLVLTITESTSYTTTITACGSYLWAADGQTYTRSGTYTGPTTGCVTEVLVLTITESTSNTTTITACGSYTWAANGQTYTTSGTYTGTTSGCKTEVLVLTISTPTTWYQDRDRDGSGNVAVTQQACTQPTGYVAQPSDCNDNDKTIYPGATEVCGNNIDDNCDGQIDEGCNNKVVLSISDATIYESAGRVILTVSLSKKSTQAVTVDYATVDGTAKSKANPNNPADFTAQSGTLTIPANALSTTVTITLVSDNVKEATEQFTVQLSKPVNAAVDKGVATVTILDGAAPVTSTMSYVMEKSTPANEEMIGDLSVRALPNPSTSYFTLVIRSDSKEAVSMLVSDAVGRMLEAKKGMSPNTSLHMGQNLKPGVYFVQVVQGGKVVTLKLVKQ